MVKMEQPENASPETIAKDLPVLLDLLKTLSTEAQSMIEFTENLLKRIKENELSTENGISLLDVKYFSLMSYIMDIILIAKMKVCGKSIADSRPVHRLVENRTVLEKINPLEHKMKYQIDKLLQQTIKSADDPMSLKPNLDDLEGRMEDDQDEEEEADTQKRKYVPPHISALHYEVDDGGDKDTQRARERALKKSSIIMELAQQASDAPLEVSEYSASRKRVQRERNERTEYEEAHLTRVNVTKKQRNAEKLSMQRSELDTITNFGDISVLENGERITPQKRKGPRKSKSGKKFKIRRR